jgi:hypothetical protein
MAEAGVGESGTASSTKRSGAAINGLPKAQPDRAQVEVESVLGVINRYLEKRMPHSRGFLDAAQVELSERVNTFTQDLAKSAIDFAAVRRGSAIDVVDVEKAYEKVVGSTEPMRQAVKLAIGGLAGGASAATAVALYLAPDNTVHLVWLWWAGVVISAVIAIVLFVMSYPRKRQ